MKFIFNLQGYLMDNVNKSEIFFFALLHDVNLMINDDNDHTLNLYKSI